MRIAHHPRYATLSLAISFRPFHVAIGVLFWTIHFGDRGEGDPTQDRIQKVNNERKN